MAKATFAKTKFNGGIYTAELDGHVDAPRRDNSVSDSLNMLPKLQGPMVRRGGSKFIKEVKTSANRTALIEFEFNVDQAYMLEFGDGYFRVFTENGAVTEAAQNITAITNANPGVITITSHGYSDGDEIFLDSILGTTQLNGNFYRVANSTANTFTLKDVDGNDIDTTSFGVYSSGGSAAKVVDVTSPYGSSDLFDSDNILQLKYTQSNDVVYIVHPDYKPRVLTRTSASTFTISALTFNDGPYLATNTTSTTLSRSSSTVTASSTTGINGGSGFLSTDVGRMIRIKSGSDWNAMTITAVGSTTSVTVDASGTLSATSDWRLGLYSDTDGWPTAVAFFEDRIAMGGAGAQPNRVDLSVTGGFGPDFVDFAPSELTGGTVLDTSAIQAPLNSGRTNVIEWLAPDEKGLATGTAGGEWWLRASVNGEALTPSNAKATRSTTRGSSNVAPASAANATLYLQRLGERLYEYAYVFEADGFRSPDMTAFAPSVTTGGIIDMAYQEVPNNTLWAVRSDGVLLGFLYDRTQDAIGWHKHKIGGTWNEGDAVVEQVRVIPSPSERREQVWIIVRRTINGNTRRYIEIITKEFDTNSMAQEDAFHCDSGLTYSGSETATVSGLEHLEGETVKVLLNGKSHPDLTVTNGVITLANGQTGTKIQIGLANSWYIVDHRIEAGGRDGPAQTKTKRITNVTVRLRNTLGLYYGPSLSVFDAYDFSQGTAFDEATPLFTGDTEYLPWPEGYETDGRVVLQHDGIFPAEVQMYSAQLITQDR